MIASSWAGAAATWDWLDRTFDDWNAWVAIGTLSLAAATAWMGWQTRRVAAISAIHADAALDSAHTSRSALESSIQPVLVDVPSGTDVQKEPVQYENMTLNIGRSEIQVHQAGEDLYCSVPLRNGGRGVALIGEVGLRWSDIETPWLGRASLLAVPPGQLTRLRFSLPGRDPRAARAVAVITQTASFSVEVRCTSVAGLPQPWTRVDYARTDAGDWEARRAVLLQPGGTTPIAIAGISL